ELSSDAFLAIDDEPISPEIDEAYYDSEGDIILLEEFLNDDPSSPPLPPQELKVVEPTNEKSSIDEPHMVELKDFPPHLEYAFLEGDDKFPDFAKPVKAISLSQDVPSTSDRRHVKLENQVQHLMEDHIAPMQPTQVNKITSSCEICSSPTTLSTASKISSKLLLNMHPRVPTKRELTTSRLVNGSSCGESDMVIKDLDLEPNVDAMMRDFLEISLRSFAIPSEWKELSKETRSKSRSTESISFKKSLRCWFGSLDQSPWNEHSFCTNRMVSDRRGTTLFPSGSSMVFL
nr:reverse transcriptase domain-containing protein [Tanacetum cinerariifolium]